ncbi:hypothetical protein P167DRAFT_87581 [Morchella conica CCBAS932]|uniref:Uncharacterized protein n=1 Tax=Morchella conica CCBAS932 TaxID=1392247 RepID=A0A3N4KTS1_9PEZI|nr:hypothetical protein P167DRAFT_87581 [Morchella conica CCBAS932]
MLLKEKRLSSEPVIRIQNPTPRISSPRCGSPQLTEESKLLQDPVASPVPMIDGEYLWAARFSDGKTHISFEIARRWDFSNEIKGLVDDFIREPINWWPLSPRRHSVSQGYVYVRWKCRCGRRISSIIPKERMYQYHMYQWLRSHSGSSSSSNNRSSPASTALAPAQPIANPVNSNAVTNGTLGDTTPSSTAVSPGAICSLKIGKSSVLRRVTMTKQYSGVSEPNT